jgi:hypothetical protein
MPPPRLSGDRRGCCCSPWTLLPALLRLTAPLSLLQLRDSLVVAEPYPTRGRWELPLEPYEPCHLPPPCALDPVLLAWCSASAATAASASAAGAAAAASVGGWGVTLGWALGCGSACVVGKSAL